MIGSKKWEVGKCKNNRNEKEYLKIAQQTLAIFTISNHSKMEPFTCKWRPLKMHSWFPLTITSNKFLRLRAYLTQFGNWWLLSKFAGGFTMRALTGRAPHPTGRTPSTGRARYNFALAEGAQRVARLWRVAHLVQRVARLCNSQIWLKLTCNHLLNDLDAQWGSMEGDWGFYNFIWINFISQPTF